MSETKEQETDETARKKPLSLAQPGKLEIKKTVESGQVRQSFSHGRSKVVAVEVRRKRTYALDSSGEAADVKEGGEAVPVSGAAAFARAPAGAGASPADHLTSEEKAVRARAFEDARQASEAPRGADQLEGGEAPPDVAPTTEELEAAAEEARRQAEEEETRHRKEEDERRKAEDEEARRAKSRPRPPRRWPPRNSRPWKAVNPRRPRIVRAARDRDVRSPADRASRRAAASPGGGRRN